MEPLVLSPKGFLFVLLFSLACISKEDQDSVTISRKGKTRDSGFAYFIEEKFSHLNIAALVNLVAENSLSCALSCLNNQACFSFNLAAFPDKAGKFMCEILWSDKYNNSEGFLPSKTFHHFSIMSPCSNLPCKDNGKCFTVYETNSYVCVCNKGFRGKHCEIDTCPAGFVIHGESCYYVDNKSSALTWDDSRIFCQTLRADLVVIKSENENQFVYNLLRNTTGVRDGWIGLYRKANNKFYWLDGRPAEGNYQMWNAGEPSNGEDEDFGRIIGGDYDLSKEGKWNDTPRSSTSPAAICQWPI